MQNNNNVGDDLDLFNLIIDLKNKIYKWRVLIIIAPLLGIVTGFCVYYFGPKEYLSRMAVTSNLLRGPAFIVIIDDLNRQIKESNTEALTKILNINEDDAKKINALKVYSSIKFVQRQLNTDMTDAEIDLDLTDFVIEAYVSNNDVLPELEKGLLYYFENNFYMRDKGTRLKKELNDQIVKIDQQLLTLDTLKKSLNQIYSLESTSKNPKMYLGNPGIIADEIIKLFTLKMELQDKAIMVDVKVVERFMPFKKPYSPKRFFTIISWFFIFVILTVLIIVLAEFNEKLKEKERIK